MVQWLRICLPRQGTCVWSAEAEALILWPPYAKSWLIGKDPDAGADSLEKTLMLERLKAGGGGDDRGCDGYVVSPIPRTWVWASSGRWRRTGKPGKGRRVRRDPAAEQQLGRSRMARGCSSRCSRAQEVQPLKSWCLQTVPGNKRSHHGERPGLAAAQEACAQQPRPSAAENKIKK